MKSIRYIDLFAGIGGFRLALSRFDTTCVFSSENNKHCSDVYRNNFGDKPSGDLLEIPSKNIPDFELLTGGFPCQPFSISGKQKGFEDTRGTLFFKICEIIKEKKPQVVILENVKNLIYHDKGNTIKVIIGSLEQLGYKVNYKVLNARDFGLPQNRERIFIIASLYRLFNFESLHLSKKTPKLKDFLEDDLKSKFNYLNHSEYTLIQNIRKQVSGLEFIGYRNKELRKKGIRENTEHLSRTHKQPNRIYSSEGVHPTLASQESSGRFFVYIKELNKVRKLTVRECYRIMGFPDSFVICSKTSEAYKQIGNSVAIPVITEVFGEIIKQGLFEGV